MKKEKKTGKNKIEKKEAIIVSDQENETKLNHQNTQHNTNAGVTKPFILFSSSLFSAPDTALPRRV